MKKCSLCLLFAITYLLLANTAGGMVFFYQEPTQYIMTQMKPIQYAKTSSGQFVPTQTNPKPAVKPVLDISGIKEIQSIPVGGMRLYELRETIEELGLKGYIPMELILDSIANLVIMQMRLVKYTKIDSETGAVILEGEFGRILKEILGIDPEHDWSMLVEHTDFIQTLLGREDYYKLTIGCREINLILQDFGTPDYLKQEYGYEWGVRGLVLTQYSEKKDARGIPYTEEKELAIHQVEDEQNPGRYKFIAWYTVRILRPDGTLVEGEQWRFIQGRPVSIYYVKF